MNDKDMLAFWKANEKPFGLATSEQRAWLSDFKGPLESYGIYEHMEWGPDKDTHIRFLGRTYRIPPDYQPEKRGRWVECELETCDNSYRFQHLGALWLLSSAPGMVGFGGVWYENVPIWQSCLGWIGNEKLQKPLKVRFWVEE